jgi:hypothetical protein
MAARILCFHLVTNVTIVGAETTDDPYALERPCELYYTPSQEEGGRGLYVCADFSLGNRGMKRVTFKETALVCEPYEVEPGVAALYRRAVVQSAAPRTDPLSKLATHWN